MHTIRGMQPNGDFDIFLKRLVSVAEKIEKQEQCLTGCALQSVTDGVIGG